MLNNYNEAYFISNEQNEYMLEAFCGRFIWDREFNVIIPYIGSRDDWVKSSRSNYFRAHGRHFIGDFCGEEVFVIWY